MKDYFQFIRNVYFFKGLTDVEIKRIISVCHKQTVNTGDIIFSENDRANKFYIVITGVVEVWKDYHKQEPDMLAIHSGGHLFGEMALIDDLPRSATVIAREKTELLYINREDFDEIISENSSIALSIMKSVSAMVRKSNESFVEGLREKNRKLEIAYQELKQAQDELVRSARLSALGKFSSLILHDIRNPLSIIRGYAEMISFNVEKHERIKKYTKKIINEADRINQLANELVDYSRGEIRLNISIVGLNNLINHVVGVIKDKFQAHGIKIITNVSYNGPVLLDRERMLRVFLNLADNARKAMLNGGIFKINIYNKGKSIYLEIIDSGVGMSEEVRKNIFEPFFSFSKSGGTGLGMCIVKSIVEAHEGTLSVYSRESQGTKFSIVLPVLN